jgi:hypothetical protein
MASDYLNLVDHSCGGNVCWPDRVRIPSPLGLNPVVFSGLPRLIRRLARRLYASSQERSSRS